MEFISENCFEPKKNQNRDQNWKIFPAKYRNICWPKGSRLDFVTDLQTLTQSYKRIYPRFYIRESKPYFLKYSKRIIKVRQLLRVYNVLDHIFQPLFGYDIPPSLTTGKDRTKLVTSDKNTLKFHLHRQNLNSNLHIKILTYSMRV